MQKIKIQFFIPILLLVTLACNAPSFSGSNETPTPSNLPLSEAGVPRVTVQDAKAAFDNGEAIIVDVRIQAAYDARHIAGAVFVPLGMIETDIASVELPKDQWIITYCT